MFARLTRRLRVLLPPYREDGNSVWGLIPGRQYDGRHVESGGLSRGEQEQALADIQEQAAHRERRR